VGWWSTPRGTGETSLRNSAKKLPVTSGDGLPGLDGGNLVKLQAAAKVSLGTV